MTNAVMDGESLASTAISTTPQRTKLSGLARKEAIDGYLFLIPNFLGFFIFSLFPMAAAVALAFTDYDLTWPPEFIGLRNFSNMMGDWLFWKTLGNTFYWALGMVIPTIIFALLLALMINRKMIGVLSFRLIYFLPHVTLMAAAAIIWLWIYHPQFGLLNWLLHLVGIEGPQWLADSSWSMPSLIFMGWWKSIGFAMLIFLAGLQGIPSELYEAAIVDGATALQQFRYITLPMLSPAIFFVLVTSLIGSFQAFDAMYLMTRGGPSFSTTTMVLHIYNNGFLYLKMGYASAMALFLFACIMLFTLVQWTGAKRWVHGFE
ncbi:MAG: sugar ABC transporter permease [Chloroflexota bacterium]